MKHEGANFMNNKYPKYPNILKSNAIIGSLDKALNESVPQLISILQLEYNLGVEFTAPCELLLHNSILLVKAVKKEDATWYDVLDVMYGNPETPIVKEFCDLHDRDLNFNQADIIAYFQRYYNGCRDFEWSSSIRVLLTDILDELKTEIDFKNSQFRIQANEKSVKLTKLNSEVVILPMTKDKLVLLLKSKVNGEFQWRLPHGEIQPTDNNVMNAAQRILLEQTDCELKFVTSIGPFNPDSDLMTAEIQSVKGIVDNPKQIKLPESNSVTDYLWASVDEIKRMLPIMTDGYTLAVLQKAQIM